MYSRAYIGYNFFVLLLKTILCEQLINTLKVAKMIYICILYLKYLETYLETLHSHFQPNCHFKMFKNSDSGQNRILMSTLSDLKVHNLIYTAPVDYESNPFNVNF